MMVFMSSTSPFPHVRSPYRIFMVAPNPGILLESVSFLVGFQLPTMISCGDGWPFFNGVIHWKIAAWNAKVAFCSRYSGWCKRSTFKQSPRYP
ncbi:hypothetical protein HanIR_Chr02g0097531 [Helianthus annuus]|nr:hypothetical protein HanIR_Chr02g0097531 [Helianthus annuus]